MKHLILIRHAESAEKVTGQTDKDRELTTAGIRQAASAGVFLRDQSVKIDIIISSSANRAETTARLISEQVNNSHDNITILDELYQASVGTMFEMIRNSDQHQNIAIVGHNPTISYFAEFITDSTVPELAPGNVLVMKVSIGNWKEMKKGSAVLLDRYEI